VTFRVCYRSISTDNDAGTVRPDGIQLLIQQEFEFKGKSNYENEMTLKPFVSKEFEIDHDSKLGRLMNRAKCNVKFPFDNTPEVDTCLINNYNGIFEAYVEEENHEECVGPETYEDGRSRRYVVRSGYKYGAMVSHDIGQSGMPIRFGYISDKFGLVTNRTTYMNCVEYSSRLVDISFTILHGRNPSWFEMKKQPGANLKMYVNSVENYFKYARNVVDEMKKWQMEDELHREYVVVLCKDHRLRAPHFDYFSLYHKYGKFWNMPTPKAAISDVTNDPQWWETFGCHTSKNIESDVCVMHYDDHSPGLFSFRVKGREVMPSVLRRRYDNLFIRQKWSPNLSFLGYEDVENTVLGDLMNDSGMNES
jgi:hypothetical protein